MGSSRRLSGRQHAAARQAAGHAARLEPHGLSATSGGRRGGKEAEREDRLPFTPPGPSSDPKQRRAAGIQVHPSHRVLERGRTSHRSALVAADAGDALLAASTARPLSADGSLPADGRGGGRGLGCDARRGPEAGCLNGVSTSSPQGRGSAGCCPAATAVAVAPARCPAGREEHSGPAGCGCLRGSVGGGHMRTSGSSRQTPLTS